MTKDCTNWYSERMQLRHEMIIDAPVERVWAHTVDVEALPSITPTMSAVERLDDGPLVVGSRVRITQPGMRPNVWTIRRLDPPHVLAWGTKIGTISITARHHVEEIDAAQTRNALVLDLSGVGAGLLGRLVRRRLLDGLAVENAGFAEAARAQGRPL